MSKTAESTKNGTSGISGDRGGFFTINDIMADFSATYKQVRGAFVCSGIEPDERFGRTIVFKAAKVRMIGEIIDSKRPVCVDCGGTRVRKNGKGVAR